MNGHALSILSELDKMRTTAAFSKYISIWLQTIPLTAMNRCATIRFYYSLITMTRSFWDQKKILVEKTDIDVALVMAFLVSEKEKTRKVYALFTGADPGFFLGGGALVSCYTSTPINHIVFYRIPAVLENRKSSWGGGGCAPPAPSP